MSLHPFSSQLIADVGISFGDEGKGRLIPEVVEELRTTRSPVSTVLKINGGANSGHTAGGIKLNLLPAGVVEASVQHLCSAPASWPIRARYGGRHARSRKRVTPSSRGC